MDKRITSLEEHIELLKNRYNAINLDQNSSKLSSSHQLLELIERVKGIELKNLE